MMLGVSCTSIGVALVPLMVIIAISESFRYRVKFLVFIVMSAILSNVFIPIMLFRYRHWSNALLPAWGIVKVAKYLGLNFHLRGKENIVQDSGCVVLINHQSCLDLCVLGELWPVLKKCTVIAKKEILYFGTFGLASWLWGTIFIDRQKIQDAQKSLNTTGQIIKDTKSKLLLFPEGKRHSNKTLLPFKKGAFHVAIASQTPIQPVVVSKYYFINDKLKRFDSGTSFVTILPPISTEGLTKDNLPELIEKTYNVMNNVFQESSQEALSNHMANLENA